MFFIQMSGVPGSGKSTLSTEISKSIDIIILDHDVIKSSLIIESGIDFNLAGKLSYNTILSLAEYYLSQGRSVLIDSPCFYNELLNKGENLAKVYKAKYKYIECRLDDLTEIDKRLKKRKTMISQVPQVESDITNTSTFLNWFDNMKRPSDIPCIIVDTSKPLPNYINKVIEYIKE